MPFLPSQVSIEGYSYRLLVIISKPLFQVFCFNPFRSSRLFNLFQVIGRRYKDSNQGSSVKVIGYDSRPILRIIPPPDAKSRRVKTFTFIEAIKKYPTTFSKSDLEFILSKVGYKQKGQLRSLFVCINDDMMATIKRGSRQVPAPASAQNPAMDTDTNESDTQAPSRPETSTSSRSRSESRSRPESRSESRSDSRSQSRSEPVVDPRSENRPSLPGRTPSHKRGAPSSGSVQPEKTARV